MLAGALLAGAPCGCAWGWVACGCGMRGAPLASRNRGVLWFLLPYSCVYSDALVPLQLPLACPSPPHHPLILLQEGDQPGSPARRGRSPSPRGGRGRSPSPRGGRGGGRSRTPPRRRTPSPRCVPAQPARLLCMLMHHAVEALAVPALVPPGIRRAPSCSLLAVYSAI